eukprot:551258-Karenia_brevis.AAC.1
MPDALPGLDGTLAYETACYHDARPIEHEQVAGRQVLQWTGREPRHKDGKAVVYTDGACSRNQDARFRRAGVGVFWCEGDCRNLSIPLPGTVQSNQRAELFAVLSVLESVASPVDIHTDS